MVSLIKAEEYFDNVKVLLTNCDRAIISRVDEEMLSELKEQKETLSIYVNSLKHSARKLEWSSNEQQREYIQEITEAHTTLEEGLSKIEVTKPVPTELKDDMKQAADTLYDCACGLLEDRNIE